MLYFWFMRGVRVNLFGLLGPTSFAFSAEVLGPWPCVQPVLPCFVLCFGSFSHAPCCVRSLVLVCVCPGFHGGCG
jgi:hypothetical protein